MNQWFDDSYFPPWHAKRTVHWLEDQMGLIPLEISFPITKIAVSVANFVFVLHSRCADKIRFLD